jgi:integrase
MPRARFQEGRLGVEGKGSKAHYYVRFRTYRADGSSVQKKVRVGLVNEMSKRDANKRKAAIVAGETSQLPEPVAGDKEDMLFGDFYETRYLVLKSDWSDKHRKSFTYIMDRFVLPKFGKLPIGKIDKVMVQSLINNLSDYTQSTLKHVREKMASVFAEALEQDYIGRNPAAKAKLPANAKKPSRPILTMEQLIQLIDRLTDARDKAIFLVGTFCALRTSEVFGLAWKHFHHEPDSQSYFMVEQVAYDGEVHEETTKTEASHARVHISSRVLEAILKLREATKDTSPDALLFQSTNKNGRSHKGAPMCPGIWLQRKVQPHADAIGIPFPVNFRATRRTACTLVQEHGGTVATAQSFLRHASPSATTKIYSQPVPEQVKLAVNAYEERVYAARKTAKLTRVK